MPPSIGLTLRKARLARGLTLEQAAAALHIKLPYLAALEEDRWEALPSEAQGRGFLRLYADFLGLPVEELLEAATAFSPHAAETIPSTEAAAHSPEATMPAAADDDPAAPIFAEIGKTLRRQRELLGVSLAEVERHTHVRQHYLQAIEEGRLDDLPSPVQGRGMLLHYARFLQIPPDPLLLQFAEALQSRHQARQQPHRRPVRVDWPWLRQVRAFLTDRLLVWVTVLLAVGLVGAGTWQVVRFKQAQRPQPTPPNVVDILFPSPTLTPTPPLPTPTPTPPVRGENLTEATVTPEANPEEQTSAPIQVFFVAQHRAWVRVVADNEMVFQGVVPPGASYTYTAETRLELLTGDGSALQVFYNQQNLGVLGRFGEVVDRVFTLAGVQTPTPTISPTPTITATPTVTATPTITPSPTPTARPLP